MRDGAGMAGVDERLVMDFSTGGRESKKYRLRSSPERYIVVQIWDGFEN
jgi:hypothetical protein